MPKKFTIFYMYYGEWVKWLDVSDNTQMNTWIKEKNVPLDFIKTKIEIYEGYVNDVNPTGKVGIAHVWAQSTSGGRTFLPQSGGRLFGDIDMYNNYFKVGNTEYLPTASQEYRGKLILVNGTGNTNDSLYICLKIGSNYEWVKLDSGTI